MSSREDFTRFYVLLDLDFTFFNLTVYLLLVLRFEGFTTFVSTVPDGFFQLGVLFALLRIHHLINVGQVLVVIAKQSLFFSLRQVLVTLNHSHQLVVARFRVFLIINAS